MCLDVRIHGSNGERANVSALKGNGTRSPDAGGADHCSLSITKWTKERKRLQQQKEFKNAERSIEAVHNAARCSSGLMAWTVRHLLSETEIKHH